MGCLGNLIWFLFGGCLTGLIWFLYGCLWCITIVGIPLGLQCFKFAKLSLFPFGKEVDYGEGIGFVSLLLNIIWIVVTGAEMAITHAVIGVLLCITIVGIPFGKQHFKIALLALLPFGASIETN